MVPAICNGFSAASAARKRAPAEAPRGAQEKRSVMGRVSWKGWKACFDRRWQAPTTAILAHAALSRKRLCRQIAPPCDCCYVFGKPKGWRHNETGTRITGMALT